MKKLILLLAGIFAAASAAQAQSSAKITFWGGPQYVSLVNVQDHLRSYDRSTLQREPTYRAAGGIDLIYNFAESYGIQSGISYSQQGQKYRGFITTDLNTNKLVDQDFSSRIYLNYLRVPLMFRFNSEFSTEDQMSLTIFAGLQYSFLRNVEVVETSPGPPDSIANRYQNYDFKQLFKKANPGIAAGAQFNIRLSPTLHTIIGVRYDRSFGSIEDLSKRIPRDAPVEWQFPVSTKKSTDTDNLVRTPNRLTSLNLYTGITFTLFRGVAPPPRPADWDNDSETPE